MLLGASPVAKGWQPLVTKAGNWYSPLPHEERSYGRIIEKRSRVVQ